jgi:four helix bundle protein
MSSVIGNQSSISRFYDLDIWKTANKLTKDIYLVNDKFPEKERYGIIDQIRRASSSVGANIAEGFGRFHYKDKLKFYYNARGSVCEVQNFIFLAQDLEYLDKKSKGIVFRLRKIK